MSEIPQILIEIDCELKPAIPAFLATRRKDCELIESLLSQDDLEEISRLGHRLKGTGGSYGFDWISDVGCQLERAAANEDRLGIRNVSEELKRYLEQVTIVYV